MIYTPHKYQKYCIDRLIQDNQVGLFLDMGLGKTIVSLTAIKDLKYYRFQVGKVLVIAPKKVAEGTWQKEALKWEHTKDLKMSEVLGTVKQRKKALTESADIYMINRENVQWLVNLYRNEWPFDTVIIDESSSFKNHKAKRFKALCSVRNHINRMVLLTGTPSPKDMGDLWSQLYLLDRGERLGTNYNRFREEYFIPGRRDGYVIYDYREKPGARDIILNKISDICVSMKAEDYLELPDMIIDDIPVKLDKKAEKAYKELEKTYILELPDVDIDTTSAAALNNKLLQLSNGAVYDEEKEYHEVHQCKIEAFMELIEKLDGESLLVFYNFKSDKERILKALKKTKLKVKELKTTKDEDDWNNGNIDVLITHPASAGYGLNLQNGGCHVCWFGLTYNLELYLQANKRLHRQGQKRTVIVHHLISEGTRDEDVMKSLSMKEDAQEYILQTLKARIEEVRKDGLL